MPRTTTGTKPTTSTTPTRRRRGAGLTVVATPEDPATTAGGTDTTAAVAVSETDPVPGRLPVGVLHPSLRNVRRDLGDLDELTDSVRAVGVLQPLVIAAHPERVGEWVIIAGHRRHAAAHAAGLDTVPVTVRADLVEAVDVVAAMLAENLHRADLTPIEEATGYQQLLDLGLTETTAAKRTGRARTTVTRRLALLRLPERVQGRVQARQITLEDAQALAEFTDDPDALARLEAELAEYGDLRHAVERERLHRDRRTKRAALISELAGQGWRLATWAHDEHAPDGAVHLAGPLARHELVALPGLAGLPDQDTRQAAHADCPHKAAYLWPQGDGWTHVCLHPTGHRPTNTGRDVDRGGDDDPDTLGEERVGLDPGREDETEETTGQDATGQAVVDQQAVAAAARVAAAQDAAEQQHQQDLTDCQAAATVRDAYLRQLTTGRIRMTEAMRSAIAAHLAVLAALTDNPFGCPPPTEYAGWLGLTPDTDDADQDEAADPEAALLAGIGALPDPHRALLAALAAGNEPALTHPSAWTPGQLRHRELGYRTWLDLLGGPLAYEWTPWEAARLDAADQAAHQHSTHAHTKESTR